jgi:hypothetical protein
MCHMCHGVACMCAHVVPIQVPDRLLPSPITHLQSAVRPGRCASNSVWPRSVTSTPHRVRTTYGRIEAGAGLEERSPQYHALQPPPTCDACGRAHASCIRIRSHATPRAPRPRAPPRDRLCAGRVVGRVVGGNRALGPAPTRQRQDRWPPAGLQPPPPRADRTTTLQRGRGCRAEATPPPGGRATPRSGSMSTTQAAENGQNRPNRARQRSRTDAPEERSGALRPGLRRLRGPNRVP